MTQEVVFSQKQSQPKHPQLLLNTTPAAYSSSQKHLRIILDENLSFTNYTNVKIQKAGIGINVIKSLNNILPQQAPINHLLDPTLTMVMSFTTNLTTKV